MASVPDAVKLASDNEFTNRTPVTTGYTYDSSTKRLNAITVNGITFSIDYQNNSNQINHIIAIPAGGSTNVTVRYSQDTTDPARIGQLVVSANGAALTETVSGYNQEDQITGQTPSFSVKVYFESVQMRRMFSLFGRFQLVHFSPQACHPRQVTNVI